MQRSRLNRKAHAAVEEVCRTAATTHNVGVDDLTDEAFGSMLSTTGACKTRVAELCKKTVDHSFGAVRASLSTV